MNLRLSKSLAVAATALLLGACQGVAPKLGTEADPTAVGGVAQAGGNLFRAVEEHVRSQGSTLSDTPHQIAYTDLNGDDLVDVLLLLNGQEWCIGESCTMMLFEGTSTGARLLSELTLVSSPVAVAAGPDSPWQDIILTLPGSAGKSTLARVSHDGESYPQSPSDWQFLADDQAMPGRPVMVGQGVSGTQLQDFDKLLASADPTAALGVDESDGGQRFYGRYSWGPGEAYFRPCGGSNVFWVTADDAVTTDLDQRYRQVARMQFDDVYLELDGLNLPAPSEGEASFYDGVLDVRKVLSMDALDEDSCSRAPRS